MGRAERRKAERRERIENRKELRLMSREDLARMRKRTAEAVSDYNVEALMICFALAEHELYGFGRKRIFRTLECIDRFMGNVLDDVVTIEDLKETLREKTGMIIKC